jgi:transposase-like protein
VRSWQNWLDLQAGCTRLTGSSSARIAQRNGTRQKTVLTAAGDLMVKIPKAAYRVVLSLVVGASGTH